MSKYNCTTTIIIEKTPHLSKHRTSFGGGGLLGKTFLPLPAQKTRRGFVADSSAKFSRADTAAGACTVIVDTA